eukprot:363870-Chlamydomonas_euryale.AAC.6
MPSACSETCIPQQDSVQQTPCNRTICGRTSKSLISPTANSCTLLSSALDVQQMASNGVPSCLPYKPNCCLRAVVGGTFVRDSKACQLVAAVHDVRHAPHVEPRRSKPHLRAVRHRGRGVGKAAWPPLQAPHARPPGKLPESVPVETCRWTAGCGSLPGDRRLWMPAFGRLSADGCLWTAACQQLPVGSCL